MKRKPVIGPTTLLMKYGSFAVAGVVCLESMGLPLPGEAILIAAAIYAGKTGGLNIVEVIAAATGKRVLAELLAVSARPPTDKSWQPMEFFAGITLGRWRQKTPRGWLRSGSA